MGDDTDTGKGRKDAGTGNEVAPTVNECIAKLHRFVPVEQGSQYAFRGHADSDWKLESTAYRRHDSPPSWDDFIKYNCQLVDDAKNANYHQKENNPLKDIEMLAELRHYSAATALIDFTRDFLVALWFACEPIKPKENAPPPNGKIFIVKTSDTEKFLQLISKDKDHTLKEILRFQTRDDRSGQKDTTDTQKPQAGKTTELWYWEPRFEINHRLSSQKGVFIFGKGDIPFEKIDIEEKDKKAIRDELNTWFGINEKRLFNDLHGFAAINDASHKIPARTWADYFRAGNEHYQQGEWEKAIGQYDKAVELKPENTDAYLKRGFAKGSLGRDEEALADFSRVIKLNPQHADAYLSSGVAKGSLGRDEEALADLSQAITLNPQHADAYFFRGIAKVKLGRDEEALADFSQAIMLNPQHADAYFFSGVTKRSLGRHEEALADLSQAITLNPQHANAYFFSGVTKGSLGRNKEALADLSQAITLNPQHANAYFFSGVTKGSLGRNKEALADLSQAITLNPQHADAYYSRGLVHKILGNIPATRADFSRALELATKQDDKNVIKRAQEDLANLPPST